jgi:hypothetical protein
VTQFLAVAQSACTSGRLLYQYTGKPDSPTILQPLFTPWWKGRLRDGLLLQD